MYRIIKATGSYADTLLALGAAELLTNLAGGDAVVTVLDRGDAFELKCSSDVASAAVPDQLWLYPFVSLEAGQSARASGEVIRYAEERERRPRRVRGERPPGGPRRGKRAAADLASEVAGAVEDQAAVDARVHLVARLNEIDKGATIKRGNELRGQMSGPGAEGVQLILGGLRAGWVPARAELGLRFERETLGQALNPHAGKGTNRPKPDGARRENLQAPAIEEWLKYAGLYSHAYARRVAARESSADIEVMVPLPADIPVDAARAVMEKARDAAARTGGRSVKFEILFILAYAELLVLHHRENFADALPRRKRVNKIVSGIEVGYFQDLGGGKSVTALYTLGLPGWFDLTGPDEVEAYLELLDEHRRCLYALDERISDHVALLLRYREFLSKEDLRDFLMFLIDYGSIVLKGWAADKGPRPRWFGEDGVKRVVRGDITMKLSEVIDSEGFRNVARAIRRSTVGEIYWKIPPRNDQIYEVRYGLGQELKRRARKPEEFLAALSIFVHAYNEENARIREQFSKQGRVLLPQRRRPDITDSDLDSVVRLVADAPDPEAVALLLVAYGFTRAHREDGDVDAGTAPLQPRERGEQP